MQSTSMTASEGRFEGVGGLRIFYRTWRPARRPRGVVVIVHGFNAHSGHYAWAAEQLTAHGLAVYALDLRGRGRSDGERFYVEQFGDYVGDVASLVRLVRSDEKGLPVFLLGPQRGRRRRVPLYGRAPGRARRPDLRELRVPRAGPRLRARRPQGAQPRRAARPRAAAEERGLLARPEDRRGDERRSVDRRRVAADENGRGDGSRRRAPGERIRARSRCRC